MKRKSYKKILSNLPKTPYRNFAFGFEEWRKDKEIAPFSLIISKILPFWLNQVQLEYYTFKKKDLQHIIDSCFNWRALIFYKWELDFEEITIIQKTKSNIEKFSFCGHSKIDKDKLEEKLLPLRNLMKAILKSEMRFSLKQVYIPHWLVMDKEFETFLNSWGLSDINLLSTL